MEKNKFYFASKENSLTDELYRYQYDLPKISVSGKQGNRTTFFENSEDFANYMSIPSIFFGKYISNKISCPSNFDKSKNCLTFKGEYNQDIITQYLHDFVKIYILCDTCDYPEINLSTQKKKPIYKTCRSCGQITEVDKKYMDKTYDFIQKNLK